MRINILLIALMAGTGVATTAAAQDKPAVPAAQTDPAAQVVCKRVEETGSLIKKKKKICHTRAEWEKLAASSRDAMAGQMSGGSNSN